jgi:hypothetical protein
MSRKQEATSIGPRKLKDLLAAVRGHQADMDSVRGDIGQLIGDAVEKNGLDKKVFALIRKLDKMEPARLHDFMETFDDYFVKSGLKTRADSAPSFQMDKPEGEADEEEQEAIPEGERPKRRSRNAENESDGNVTRMRPAAE